MGKINFGRVLLSGIVAGIVIDIFEGIVNGVLLNQQWATVMSGIGKPAQLTTNQLIAFNVWGLVLGILTMWTYAAIRPRYGAGPRTAMCAGLFAWALAYGLGFSGSGVILGIFPMGMTVVGLAAQLVEMLVAAVAGAAVYKESSFEGSRSAAARA